MNSSLVAMEAAAQVVMDACLVVMEAVVHVVEEAVAHVVKVRYLMAKKAVTWDIMASMSWRHSQEPCNHGGYGAVSGDR